MMSTTGFLINYPLLRKKLPRSQIRAFWDSHAADKENKMRRTETKYKVGDRVTVRKDLKAGKYYHMKHDPSIMDVVAGTMTEFAGRRVTIKSIAFGGKYRIEEGGFNWTDEMFEEPEQTIVIYRNGRCVIAYDKITKKKAKAKCNPEDTFDFGTGAKLALDRLLESGKEPVFKVGDIVIGTAKASQYYSITREGVICRVIPPDRCTRDDQICICQLGSLGSFNVDPTCFRLATDKDITLELLLKCIK